MFPKHSLPFHDIIFSLLDGERLLIIPPYQLCLPRSWLMLSRQITALTFRGEQFVLLLCTQIPPTSSMTPAWSVLESSETTEWHRGILWALKVEKEISSLGVATEKRPVWPSACGRAQKGPRL